jgi:predicted DsbA family dithiol-disulfide isomerase
VPYFILSDGKRRIRMSGAQPPEQFLDALEQLGAIDDA